MYVRKRQNAGGEPPSMLERFRGNSYIYRTFPFRKYPMLLAFVGPPALSSLRRRVAFSATASGAPSRLKTCTPRISMPCNAHAP